jgi:hypothetical protein
VKWIVLVALWAYLLLLMLIVFVTTGGVPHHVHH